MLETATTRTTLDREVARAAGRLAAFLAASFSRTQDELADGIAFLETMGRTPDSNGRYPAFHEPADLTPLELLIEYFRFSPLDVILLVLAGLPEEHEGFSAVFRSLHPRGEPYPTAGLAAQLLFGDTTDRQAIRAALQTGPLATSGAVRSIGDGPFFERSLRPAESLWFALRGLDVWPAALRPYAGPIAVNGLEEWLGTPGPRNARRSRSIAR